MAARKKNPTPGYEFAVLAPDLAAKLGLSDLPMPVRKTMVSTVFGPDEVRLRDVLTELDIFVKKYPLSAGRYREAAGNLAMIAATQYMEKDNAKLALMCLSTGLRIAPDNMTLRVHQALALQMNGYNGAAADEYAQILNHAPQAYDPVLRALATKAFAAIGEWDRAFAILQMLPEEAFQDPGLSRLREWVLSRGELDLDVSIEKPKRFCTECGSTILAEQKFCTNCGFTASR